MGVHAAVLSGICVTDSSVYVYMWWLGRGLACAGSTVESHKYVDWSVICSSPLLMEIVLEI
jgi:hypothetical protein